MGLDAVELVMQIESEFGLEIPDSDAARLATVGQLYDYLRDRLAGPGAEIGGRGPYAGPLWERVLDVIEKEIGVERRRLRPTARFVTDLGLD